MDIPPEILLQSINDFCILFFKDTTHNKNAPPHFYVAFPVKDGQYLVICILTSQVESQKNYYRRTNPKAVRSLIQISRDDLSFLNKDTAIDCNRAEMLSREELKKRINSDPPLQLKERKIPSYLKKEICSGIVQSPLIPPYLKKLIKRKTSSEPR